jgi:type II secretory pathway component PulF
MLGSADSNRASLYRQLASLEDAGIPLRTALERVSERDLLPVGRALDEGLEPGDAWSRAACFTPLEVTLVRAGARSGQLAESFHSLSQVFEETAQTKRSLIAGFAYPVILIHLAVLLPKLYVLVGQGLGPYARATLVPLAIGYAAIVSFVALGRAFARMSPAAAGSLLQAVPLLGKLLVKRALAHALGTLVAVYRAGVPVTEAVEAAAATATLFPVRAGFLRIRRRLEEGATIGEAFQAETTFPKDVREAAATGALTGKLEEQLGGARRRLESEAALQRSLLITILPIVTYLAVAFVIGYMVISFWTNLYGGQLDALLK